MIRLELSAWRGHRQREEFRRTQEAVKTLQRATRWWLAARRLALEAAAQDLAAASRNEANRSADLRLNLSDVEEEEGLSPTEFFTARSALINSDTETTPRSSGDNTLTTDGPSSSDTTLHDINTRQAMGRRVIDTNSGTPIYPHSLSPSGSPSKDDANAGLSTPHGRRGARSNTSPEWDNGLMLYSSPKTGTGHMSPVSLPILHTPSKADREDDQGGQGQAEAYYVVCEERSDGCNTYHIMPSPCPGGRRERPAEVLRRVTTSISTTYLSRWRFNLAGAFRGIPYLEAQNGIVSRRRMPRVS